jgi:hypothetical protein
VQVLCWVLSFGVAGAAFAQEAPLPRPVANVEEIIVPGRTPENLRVEIERLQLAVYDRFNALNANDELDIKCFEQAPTGSNIPLRTCAPKFVIDAEASAARKMLHDGRGGAGNNNNPGEEKMRMGEKSRQLTAEMQRIAREDEQLMRDLARLDELNRLQAGAPRTQR